MKREMKAYERVLLIDKATLWKSNQTNSIVFIRSELETLSALDLMLYCVQAECSLSCVSPSR